MEQDEGGYHVKHKHKHKYQIQTEFASFNLQSVNTAQMVQTQNFADVPFKNL